MKCYYRNKHRNLIQREYLSLIQENNDYGCYLNEKDPIYKMTIHII